MAASLLGNSAMSLVAGIWVKALPGSSAQAGLVSACIYGATMGAPVAGLIADRVPRVRLLLWLNVLSAVTILPLLIVSSRSEAWVVFVVMAVYGIEATLMDPAEDALFAQMFSIELRARVNGWRLMIQETGRLGAPLLGAALFVLAGGGAASSPAASSAARGDSFGRSLKKPSDTYRESADSARDRGRNFGRGDHCCQSPHTTPKTRSKRLRQLPGAGANPGRTHGWR